MFATWYQISKFDHSNLELLANHPWFDSIIVIGSSFKSIRNGLTLIWWDFQDLPRRGFEIDSYWGFFDSALHSGIISRNFLQNKCPNSVKRIGSRFSYSNWLNGKFRKGDIILRDLQLTTIAKEYTQIYYINHWQNQGKISRLIWGKNNKTGKKRR